MDPKLHLVSNATDADRAMQMAEDWIHSDERSSGRIAAALGAGAAVAPAPITVTTANRVARAQKVDMLRNELLGGAPTARAPRVPQGRSSRREGEGRAAPPAPRAPRSAGDVLGGARLQGDGGRAAPLAPRSAGEVLADGGGDARMKAGEGGAAVAAADGAGERAAQARRERIAELRVGSAVGGPGRGQC